MRHRSCRGIQFLQYAALVATLLFGPTAAMAQRIQFYPIRVAPLGSPAGTVGNLVTATFNDALDCWELRLPGGGFEVDIDIQGGGWGNAPGNPSLGAIQATVESAGYHNGVGADLNPKGWPGSPSNGVYMARMICGAGGDARPCDFPFDHSCSTGGFCVTNPYFIFPPAMAAAPLCHIGLSTLE